MVAAFHITVLAQPSPPTIKVSAFNPPSPFPLTHLIDCLETNCQPAATIQEARHSLIVALAAYQSASQRRPVHMTW